MGQLQIKVQPSSSKREIILTPDGTIKVYLHSAAEKNKANKELIKYLADVLDVSKSQIRIVRGQTSRTKVLDIEDTLSIRLKDLASRG